MNELGLSFETADRSLPAKEIVADYYRRYEEHYDLQVVRPASVDSVVNEDTHLRVSFTDAEGGQEVSTDIVVNATGTWGAPFVPWYPGRDSFRGRQVHTGDYIDASEFAGQSVVVVGGGTSAIGFLLELEQSAAELTWGEQEAHRLPRRHGADHGGRCGRRRRAGRGCARRPCAAQYRERNGHPAHAQDPGRHRSGRAAPQADVRAHRAGRSALGRWRIPSRRRDRLGDRLPAGAASPRPAQASREGGRRRGCRRVRPGRIRGSSSRDTARRRAPSEPIGRAG
ncbi:MAG: NAD(P)-binding domain-containing protein [Galbitalea sp.]